MYFTPRNITDNFCIVQVAREVILFYLQIKDGEFTLIEHFLDEDVLDIPDKNRRVLTAIDTCSAVNSRLEYVLATEGYSYDEFLEYFGVWLDF